MGEVYKWYSMLLVAAAAVAVVVVVVIVSIMMMMVKGLVMVLAYLKDRGGTSTGDMGDSGGECSTVSGERTSLLMGGTPLATGWS